MYQAPLGARTDAWNPSGLRSAWIVAARIVDAATAVGLDVRMLLASPAP